MTEQKSIEGLSDEKIEEIAGRYNTGRAGEDYNFARAIEVAVHQQVRAAALLAAPEVQAPAPTDQPKYEHGGRGMPEAPQVWNGQAWVWPSKEVEQKWHADVAEWRKSAASPIVPEPENKQADLTRASGGEASKTAAEWKMPDAPELFAFINRHPIVTSLLYDLNLLPEQITDARRWGYLVAVCQHMDGWMPNRPACENAVAAQRSNDPNPNLPLSAAEAPRLNRDEAIMRQAADVLLSCQVNFVSPNSFAWHKVEETLDALRSRLASPSQAREGWQPIATRPMDGTRYLAICGMGLIRLVRQADIDDRLPIGDPADTIWPDLPTHWMPLPAAPSDAQPQGAKP